MNTVEMMKKQPFDIRLAQVTQSLVDEGKISLTFTFRCNCVIHQSPSGRIRYGDVMLCNGHREVMGAA